MNQDVKVLPVVAYMTTDDEGSPAMLFFDRAEALTYCDDEQPRELCDRADAQSALAELRAENANLKTVMVAAAEEIHHHWDAHCDAEGYGPANLMRRLEEGIPSQYGYTAGAFAELRAEVEMLRTDGAYAVRWAPSSAHWSEVLRELFGPDARDGINRLETRLREERQRADTAEARLNEAKTLLREAADCAHWAATECAHKGALGLAERIDAFLGEGK